MIKRELERMETIHNLYVGYKNQLLISDSLLLILVFIAISLNVSSVILSLYHGRTWLVVGNILLVFVNIYSTVITVRRMVETRKELKEENRLHEEARQEMLEIFGFEEDGYEVEFDEE